MVEQNDEAAAAIASATAEDRQHVGPLSHSEQLRWLDRLEREAGRRYVDCRLNNFHVRAREQFDVVERCREYIASIEERIAGGDGMLLIGPVGTGKDHLAFALARGTIVRGFSAAWVDGLRWYTLMRDRIQQQRSESEAIWELLQPSLLVLSDPLPPAGELSNYEASNLLRIVHRRYIEQRPTLLTVNLTSEDEGRELIGDQAWDRLIHGAELVWCRWESYRRHRPPPRE